MTPYYSDDSCVIYHGDCRELLPTLSFDVVITDPPYNVGLNYGAAVDDEQENYSAWCRSWFTPARLSSRLVAVSPGIPNVGMWYTIEKPSWMLAWHKPAAMGRCTLGFNNWEPVIVWGRAGTQATSDHFLAPIIPDETVEGHPCPKPLKWGRWLVTKLTLESDTIIDPFLGSGTTMRAAKDNGRRSIGIEINEAYCEIAAKRLSQEVLSFPAAASPTPGPDA